MDDAGYQIGAALDGMTETDLDHKMSSAAMSPREQMIHLCEVYTAIQDMAAGKEHAWGSYAAPTTDFDGLLTTLKELRAQAIAAILAAEDEAGIKLGSGFVVGHDSYHVGQLVASRITTQPDWNSYSIYKM